MFLFNTHNNCRLLNYFEKCLNVCFEVRVFQLIVCLFINIFCLFINMLGESRSEGTSCISYYYHYILQSSVYSIVFCFLSRVSSIYLLLLSVKCLFVSLR